MQTDHSRAAPNLAKRNGEGASESDDAAVEGPKRKKCRKRKEGKGGRKRAASDTGSSTSSSRSGNSVKANHQSTSAKVVLAKWRQQSGRQGNVLERHRHHSVSGVPGDGAHRAGAREEAPEAQAG